MIRRAPRRTLRISSARPTGDQQPAVSFSHLSPLSPPSSPHLSRFLPLSLPSLCRLSPLLFPSPPLPHPSLPIV